MWDVLFDVDCEAWFGGLRPETQDAIVAQINILRQFGPNLGRPQVDSVKGSRHSNMKELRVQIGGDPWRLLFAFDPRRTAIVLLGGSKLGDKRWYKVHIPIADARFDRHPRNLEAER